MPRKKPGVPTSQGNPVSDGDRRKSSSSPSGPPPAHGSSAAFDARLVEGERFLAKVDDILPNPRNVREEWEWENDPEFEEFVGNIEKMGVLQDPAVIERSVFEQAFPKDSAALPERGKYVLAMGERRWRAARRLGLVELPVVLNNHSADRMDEVLWSENQSRKGLNPLQEGLLFKRFRDEESLELEQIAQRLGDRNGKRLSVSSISKKIRLLDFPEGPARTAIRERELGVEPAYLLLTRLRTAELIERAWQLMTGQGLSAKAATVRLTAPAEDQDSFSSTKTADVAGESAPDAMAPTVREQHTEDAEHAEEVAEPSADSATIPPQPAARPVASDRMPASGSTTSRAASATPGEGGIRAELREKACTALLKSRVYPPSDTVAERLAEGILRWAEPPAHALGGRLLKTNFSEHRLTGALLVRAADAILLAASELRVRRSSDWDDADVAYVRSLVDGVGYVPSDEEETLLQGRLGSRRNRQR